MLVPITLVLGLFAGLYLLCLLFRLAVHARPIYVAVAVGFVLRAHGSGIAAAILIGIVAGFATLAVGRVAFDRARTAGFRVLIASAFAVPTGIAGYQAAHSIGGLALGSSVMLDGLSLIGAGLIAATAWVQFGSGGVHCLGDGDRFQSGNANCFRSGGGADSPIASRIELAIVSAARSRMRLSRRVSPTRAQPGADRMAAAIDSWVM
jgi:hypothetical protein